jgi:hypothetical protein
MLETWEAAPAGSEGLRLEMILPGGCRDTTFGDDRIRLAAQAPAMARLLWEIMSIADEENERGEPALGDDHKAAVEYLLEVSDHIRAILREAGVIDAPGVAS